LLEVQTIDPRLGNHDDIGALLQQVAVPPEQLSKATLDEVSNDRPADLAADRQPDAGIPQGVLQKNQMKVGGSTPPTAAEDVPEVVSVEQPGPTWQGLPRWRRRRVHGVGAESATGLTLRSRASLRRFSATLSAAIVGVTSSRREVSKITLSAV